MNVPGRDQGRQYAANRLELDGVVDFVFLGLFIEPHSVRMKLRRRLSELSAKIGGPPAPRSLAAHDGPIADITASRCQLTYHIGKPAISALWLRQHTHEQNNWMTRKRWHGLARHAQDQWAKNGGRDMAVQSMAPTIR